MAGTKLRTPSASDRVLPLLLPLMNSVTTDEDLSSVSGLSDQHFRVLRAVSGIYLLTWCMLSTSHMLICLLYAIEFGLKLTIR